jgi:hypothetical protein
MQQLDNPAQALAWYGRAQLASKGSFIGEANRWSESIGAPPLARRLIAKGPMPAGSMSDPTWGGTDLVTAQNAFMTSMQTASVFYRIFNDDGFLRVPLRTRIGAATGAPTGYIIGEGQPVPVSRLTLENNWLAEVLANAVIVVTDELVRNITPAGQILFNRLLREAVAAVIDRQFLALVTDSDTPVIDSLGPDSDAIMPDLRALLGAVNSGATPSLYLVVASDVAKRAATYPEKFPAMSPVGGEMLHLPAVVSNVVDEGTITLLDGAGIAADAGDIRIRTSAQADIEMATDPSQDGTTGDGAQMVSMFQSNSAALMAIASFGVQRLRDDAVAVLQGVIWGDGVSG